MTRSFRLTTSLPMLAAGLAATALLLAPGSSGAQTFRDWTLACERGAAASPEVCSLRQFVAPKERPRQPVLAVAVGRLTPDRRMAMVVKLPPQADRASGIGVRVDDGQIVSVPIQSCDEGSCTAALTLTNAFLDDMKRGRQMIIAFRGQKQEAAALPVSLSGLTRGLQALGNR